MADEYLDTVWKEHPEYIRKYYDLLPRHERLCNEVEYILETEIENAGIEIAHITSRAKTLSSFCEKVHRKLYKDPFSEITDLAGARVVYLYISDIQKIGTVVEKEFDIIKKVNKVTDQDIEKLGYGALHYIVKIKKEHSGARYDDLKNLICEIQVRTILQDAWAIVAHHLSYKQESDIPNELRRKLNALSGLFETADDQFERLRVARSQYQEKVKEEISKGTGISLEQEINLDNLVAYIKWKFPDRWESETEAVADLLTELQEYAYVRLVDIDDIIENTKAAVLAYEKDDPPQYIETSKKTKYNGVGLIRSAKQMKYNGVGLIRSALSFVNGEYCKKKYSESKREKLGKYHHLIKRNA